MPHKIDCSWADGICTCGSEANLLRSALQGLVDDLEDRARWMRFQPAKDGLTVPCGCGVFIRAKDALAAGSPKCDTDVPDAATEKCGMEF